MQSLSLGDDGTDTVPRVIQVPHYAHEYGNIDGAVQPLHRHDDPRDGSILELTVQEAGTHARNCFITICMLDVIFYFLLHSKLSTIYTVNFLFCFEFT